MPIGAITGYIDVAQLVLYAFWIFFFGLIFYLRQEDKREGYPLVPDPSVPSDQHRGRMEGFPPLPKPKVFRLADGSTRQAPNEVKDPDGLKAEPMAPWPGAPLIPTGNPMLDAVGPAAYAQRPDEPEKTVHGDPRMAPLRVAGEYSVESRDPDPRGMPVVGADGKSGGEVVDIWIDRSELQIRYLEIKVGTGGGETTQAAPAAPAPAGAHATETATAAEGNEESNEKGNEGVAAAPDAPAPVAERRVLVPITFTRVDGYRRIVKVNSILSSQFADVPVLGSPDQVTQLEEDRISAYYGGGTLYATAGRQEPWL